MLVESIPHVAIIVTPEGISELAALVVNVGAALPADFQPAAWLHAHRVDLKILADEAVKDVVFDALLFGLEDHPLLKALRMSSNGKDCC